MTSVRSLHANCELECKTVVKLYLSVGENKLIGHNQVKPDINLHDAPKVSFSSLPPTNQVEAYGI